MPSKSIHVVANGKISFFTMSEEYTIYIYIYVTFCLFIPTWLVGEQYATEVGWKNNYRKNEEAEPKWK